VILVSQRGDSKDVKPCSLWEH